ncbi:MAG: IMP dehydrogenase [Candidatus Dadabacteria bacterium]|nr:IMP dehydrogenase [Candidatus Dadabacteria bacterium]NIS08199.1 IMP dehydrogenase [Candidatus Dadabacteria bacterium]NIV41445.1 IMP dehydrogenase [Candidatus Dadabacteria bacterium]NIY21689.1 IMP dehydrogenase [Candidatus Dadabacteria bacterium]
MLEDKIEESLTFDDVLLLPSYSEVLPGEVDVSTLLTPNIKLNIPLISAAMDTVTEAKTAISMASEGGIGIIHKNFTIEDQASEVEKVKKYEGGMIINPLTVRPDNTVGDAVNIMLTKNITGLPVTRSDNTLLGIVTYRDLRFEKNLDYPVKKIMTKKSRLVTVNEDISLESAKQLLHKYKIEKLPVVNDEFKLTGLITMKDIEKIEKHPLACKDRLGRLRCGAAVGVGDDRESRVQALIDASCDVIVIDTAHGHSQRVIDAIKSTKKNFPDTELIAGNIATTEAAEALIKAGADCLKIGVGPGSICTTRVIAGIGVPQITAITNVLKAAKKHNVPVVADGGIKYSGDITKAISAGANSVMIGNLFAGADEAPGEVILYQGRTYKVYRGMGSIEAMKKGSKDRYSQDEMIDSKLVPEGIEGRIPNRGSIGSIIYQLLGGLRAGMGYTGCASVAELREKSKFTKITNAGLKESHVHDVIITKEAPNYRVE